MPKDEFDFDDPMELNGMALVSEEDTTDAMVECFIEEFMRLGYDHAQLLALFTNPHYVGLNMVLQNRGELYVKNFIAAVFAQWGRPILWPCDSAARSESAQPHTNEPASAEHPQKVELDSIACDPTGTPVPKLNF